MRKKIVFGLGNYGVNYANTRHNVGFDLLERVVKYCSEDHNHREKVFFENKRLWEVLSKNIKNEEIFFVRVKDFINNCGFLIKKFVDILNSEINDIILIHDDVSMEFGKVRFRKNSSSGGHNGVKSVIEKFGSNEFCRLKIGVGGKDSEDLKKWVLGKFAENEMNKMDKISQKAAEVLLSWIEKKI